MNIIVIGLGSMGKRRIRLLRGICPSYRIIGVDSNPDRVREAAQEYQVTSYSDIAAAKEKEQIQCAFICTSPLSHASIIRTCLLNDWHVFTEINLVSDGYEDNRKLAEERGLTLFLSSTPVYRGEMQKIKEVLGQDGKPVTYLYHVGQYLPDWHPWENFQQFFVHDKRTNGCREIFAIELPWMIQTFGKIVDVHVISSRRTSLQIDYQDSYLVQITHENGTQGIFAADVVCREAVRHLEIYNEEIYMEWRGTPDSLRQKNLNNGEMEALDAMAAYEREAGYSTFVNEYAYVNEIKEFLEVLLEKKPMCYGFREDRETLQWIDRIEQTEQLRSDQLKSDQVK